VSLSPGNCGLAVKGEDFVAGMEALQIKAGTERAENEEMAFDKASAEGHGADFPRHFVGRIDIGVAVLKLHVEGFKDAVIIRCRASCKNLRNEVAIRLVPIELRDVPEVGKAVLGLSPKLGGPASLSASVMFGA
jgi:hypothetical protein